jgi:Holliday junction resolvasome RuvABC ATP-dependent DNA helicase subunit
MPIDEDAAELLLSRCHQSGAPYELKILFRECAIFATAAGEATITREVVDDVLTTYEIDEHGLRPLDRAVMRALFQRPRYRGKAQEFICYGGSESDVCAVARLDKVEFQETVRPRLLSRGFLEVRAGVGLALTPRAVTEYARLQS